MYPVWFTMAVLVVIEIILIKKTLFDKDIIILSNDNWINIFWITLAVICWVILILYCAQTHEIKKREGEMKCHKQ